MSSAASFETFEKELARLVAKFERGFAEFKVPRYQEMQLRDDFLTPFFAALGWDMQNNAGLIQSHREVEIESRVDTGRADYLFRIHRRPRFVCEAKKPAEALHGHAQQAKSYAWTVGVPLAVLSDFEELYLYIVGSEPKEEEPLVGLWKTYSFREYVAKAREFWDLLARDNVAGGHIDRVVAALPKRRLRIGKGQFIIRPDPTKNFDNSFLTFLDGARRSLASDLLRHNENEPWTEGTRLNEAVQCILDRLLFIRISEARGIDMGTKLLSLLEIWQKRRPPGQSPSLLREEPPAGWGTVGLTAPRGSLWHSIVGQIRALDRRPPSHVPFFNGTLLKQHFSEELVVGDDWLGDFLQRICNDYASYKFGYIAVEILGTIYERFLGKIVRPHGRGAVIEEKPEVRKAGGVYYTPRYIVEYIVEQTVGKLLEGKKPEETLRLRFLDPACGSGSFLLRVFERVCEHWQQWLMDHPGKRKKDWCWLDAKTNTLFLTARLKRQILRETIYGVDLDPQAVEVTQLSLYLKMLEGETTETLQREQDLFGGDEAILPPLQDNIKCGNSLIASDFSVMREDLVRVRAFDWNVGFEGIMRAGGFDAVVGNPPYIRIQTLQETDPAVVEYFKETYKSATRGNYDIYVVFIERVLGLLNKNGKIGYIVPHKFFNMQYGEPLRGLLAAGHHLSEIVHFGDQQIFEGASTYTCLLFLTRACSASFAFRKVSNLSAWRDKMTWEQGDIEANKVTAADWSFGVGKTSQLMERLKAGGPSLGEFTDIFVGLQTSADTVFLFKEWEQMSAKVTKGFSKELNDWVEVESSLLKSVVRSGAIGRYWAKPEAKVLFPYEFVDGKAKLIPETRFIKNYPKAWAYLNRNKNLLANREHGKFKATGWYQLYPKNLNVWERAKLLVPYMITELSACLDASNTYFVNVTTGGFGIVSRRSEYSLKYLCGLLNSSALNFFLKQVSTNFRGGYFAANKQFIEQLPIRAIDFSNPADKSRHDKLVLMVDKQLRLIPELRAAMSASEKAVLQNAVTATDQQIDALVYELYGLTPEEIALVEGTK